jgi:acetyltransferase-like isoleucine patch superfamily enzyme
VLGLNRHVPWPASPSIGVVGPENIDFDPDDLNNFQTFGCYFQCPAARIRLGHGTYIAPNVGLITSNHDPLDAERHLPGQDIAIGRQCWIGMNAVILPGVELGDHTTVGAGAVVTRSFPEGHCILAGVPAQVIRTFGRPTPADAHQR